jgi:hypothetical protein
MSELLYQCHGCRRKPGFGSRHVIKIKTGCLYFSFFRNGTLKKWKREITKTEIKAKTQEIKAKFNS